MGITLLLWLSMVVIAEVLTPEGTCGLGLWFWGGWLGLLGGTCKDLRGDLERRMDVQVIRKKY